MNEVISSPIPIGIQIATLRSIQVGQPALYTVSKGAGVRDDGPTERVWESSFVRVPSSEPRWLYTTHLEGNAQADTRNHGSLPQAVLLYAAAHYPVWRAELQRQDMGPGGFAENFTVDGLDEQTACIGDIYAVGDAQIQVTGPRYPCWKIERRWGLPGLTARVVASGRTGWFCRVLREGMIEPDLPVVLLDRPYPQWTIALVNDFGHNRNKDLQMATALAGCPFLNPWWQELVVKRAAKA